MKLAIICSRLEPEADGVGDYCRCLTDQLRALGVEVLLIGLADYPLDSPSSESGLLRLPRSMPLRDRIRLAREQLESFSPDWISFQFVPYAFHPKGFVHGLGRTLVPLLKGFRVQFMFHETWIGFEESSSRKDYWMGRVQRFFVRQMIKELRPNLIQTSNQGYQWLLSSIGIEAELLPLFGNVGWSSTATGWMEAKGRHNPEKEIVFGIFGNLPIQFNIKNFYTELLQVVQPSGRQIGVWTIGRIGEKATAELEEVFHAGPGKVRHFGRQPADHVSAFLQEVDWGVATAPANILGKSGAVAAMIEHGLPVVVFRDLERIRGMAFEQPSHPRMFFPHHDLRGRFHELKKIPPESSRSNVAQSLIESLSRNR